MKLGIFGGTFDPIHHGHLILADHCRDACELDEVWFVPAASPPHKDDSKITPAQLRADMVELAVAGCPELAVSRIELDRTGPSYTVDTLQQLADEDVDRELFLIIGADSLADLPTWREPERIASLATIIVVNRGRAALPDEAALIQKLGEAVAGRIQAVTIPPIDISSTRIRERVRQSRTVRFLTPRAVETLINEHRLYE